MKAHKNALVFTDRGLTSTKQHPTLLKIDNVQVSDFFYLKI